MKEFRAQGSESPPVIRQWAVQRPARWRRVLIYASAIYCSLVLLVFAVSFLLTEFLR
ncbi:hypothetical protein [Nocardia altamirensis]|uniref:hypothetical protein n=1 Tax=Nocardia altamirensis TaxID=472158 RepID=UPI0014354C28|nr:hypothetical protein [Nocardia altamirensis]